MADITQIDERLGDCRLACITLSDDHHSWRHDLFTDVEPGIVEVRDGRLNANLLERHVQVEIGGHRSLIRHVFG